MVCIGTFISLLFAQKFLLKFHRTNVISYLLAFILTAVLYFSFIEIFGLQRVDYFFDGVRFFTKYFETFSHVAFITAIQMLNVFKTISIQDFPALFRLTEALISYLGNLDISICAYLALHASYKFRRKISFKVRLLISKMISSCFIANKTQSINCVFNC